MTTDLYDAVVIGGGFFGCELAAYLKTKRGFRNVVVVEQETQVIDRASRWNQARIHGGYHYPRNFVTARRSRVSQPLFLERYSKAVYRDVTSLYAIARRGSHVTAPTFLQRMKQAGASITPASPVISDLFSSALVEGVFEVEEAIFDADELRRIVENRLEDFAIEVNLNTRIYRVADGPGHITLTGTRVGGGDVSFSGRYVFNCTYSGLNSISENARIIASNLKYEVAELALLKIPDELGNLAITVMDGPFFSVLPYPPETAHSLSHVRYTPYLSWDDEVRPVSPDRVLRDEPRDQRSVRMLRDAARFVPKLEEAKIIGSFREVKTVIAETEENDGRPILVEQSREHRRLFSILGGKIDNVFDMFQFFDSVEFDLERRE